jgi:hypothetical protein
MSGTSAARGAAFAAVTVAASIALTAVATASSASASSQADACVGTSNLAQFGVETAPGDFSISYDGDDHQISTSFANSTESANGIIVTNASTKTYYNVKLVLPSINIFRGDPAGPDGAWAGAEWNSADRAWYLSPTEGYSYDPTVDGADSSRIGYTVSIDETDVPRVSRTPNIGLRGPEIGVRDGEEGCVSA